MRAMFMKHLARTLLICLTTLSASNLQADANAVEDLRLSVINKDFEEFNRILDSGVIGLDEFSSNPRLYETVCASTYEAYDDYFDRFLEYGVDPSLEDPLKKAPRYALLLCANGKGNLDTFVKLLDAGARSDVITCAECDQRIQSPLVVWLLRFPEMFQEVVKRRELTEFELAHVARRISSAYYHKTWQGQPLNEWYADYLHERGYDVEPKGRLTP